MLAMRPTKCFQRGGVKKAHFLVSRSLINTSLFSCTWIRRFPPKPSDNMGFYSDIITVTDYTEIELYWTLLNWTALRDNFTELYWERTVLLLLILQLYCIRCSMQSKQPIHDIVHHSFIGRLPMTCSGMLWQLICNIVDYSSIAVVLRQLIRNDHIPIGYLPLIITVIFWNLKIRFIFWQSSVSYHTSITVIFWHELTFIFRRWSFCCLTVTDMFCHIINFIFSQCPILLRSSVTLLTLPTLAGSSSRLCWSIGSHKAWFFFQTYNVYVPI